MDITKDGFPACVCGKKGQFIEGSSETTPVGPGEKKRLVYYACCLCGRPAVFINHPGGNAFVIPLKSCETFPQAVEYYIFETLIPFFGKNHGCLLGLRYAYEEEQYLKICQSLKINADRSWGLLPEKIQFKLSVRTGRIFANFDGAWLEPEGFDPSPVPPQSLNARIYFLKKQLPVSKESVRGWTWYVLSEEKKKE